ncbi:hypothetical protein OKW76_03475 [Sphingomonas sp. S1-29]|uniref:hypothetical protein n=1 Tax=Sphingomonas sp. S1-29 TaxID=2991074 RepID=UPI00223E9E01|nr:hypothetical protein [Sphingomonas sp. S1-29]UZK70126.1 hypothetical protein OKW76_03475 [Sphingomonas sp. S1-29]
MTDHDHSIVDRTKDAAAQAFDTTKAQTALAVDKTRETVVHAYDTTRKTTGDAVHQAVDGIESNPLAALVGGIAVGVAIGALLPRTQAEARHLGPIGKRLNESASAAVRAARDQGKQELSGLVPDKSNAKEKAGSVVEAVIQAARSGAKTV